MAKIYLIFFGPPGSGKGTQAEIIAQKLDLPIVSTGNVFRREQESGTDLGIRIKDIVAKGALVPDEIVDEIIINQLNSPEAERGLILDGYPRTILQSNFLFKNLAKLTNKEDKIYGILIDTSDKEVILRLANRQMCKCGAVYHSIYKPAKKENICNECQHNLYTREDDKPEVIANRLEIYHSSINEVLQYWKRKRKLITISGEESIAEVSDEILEKLNSKDIYLSE